jgi:hypothetical protein
MIYRCCNDARRDAVRSHSSLNGIDSLEVLDRDLADPLFEGLRQRTLLVRMLKKAPPLVEKNIVIEGGEPRRRVGVLWVRRVEDLVTLPPGGFLPGEDQLLAALAEPEPENVLIVRTDSNGDALPFVLRLVAAAESSAVFQGIDPVLGSVEFSFKVECPSDRDCGRVELCREPAAIEPAISYLAKDYASFRRLLLDRLRQLVPGWRESSPADLGVTLVELLAYVADQLSYEQDAIATEAYLATARRRVSVRRHARLVDYAMHDGRNARAWVHIDVDTDGVALTPTGAGASRPVQFFTRAPGAPARIEPPELSPAYQDALRARPRVFELVADALPDGMRLWTSHGRIRFHTWGDRECCLPRGATRATLRGPLPQLVAGAVLILEEVLGPRTGRPDDAKPAHRAVVRLVSVVSTMPDGSGAPLVDPLTNEPIVEIRWHGDDALAFPLCISSWADLAETPVHIEDVSVARGNVVLVDHGKTIDGEALGSVPAASLASVDSARGAACAREKPTPLPPRFRPALRDAPLSQASVHGGAKPVIRATSGGDAARWPSAMATLEPPRDTYFPAVKLFARSSGGAESEWSPVPDLLASRSRDPHFVAELESDGTVYLRFGDDQHGERPNAGLEFRARYRVGNGESGNVGADAIAHVVTDAAGIIAVRNPLPARGGVEPESADSVRRNAPWAFRSQERAVTADDWARKAERHPEVDRAAASFRWTGSWHTVFVTVDRRGGRDVDPAFEKDLRRHLEPFRLAGYDLEIDGPRYVPLEIDVDVCVRPDHFRSDVRAELRDVLSSRELRGGRRGLFHPDRFSFGESLYLSGVYAAVQAVPGVAEVHVTKFQRLGVDDPDPLREGVLPMGRLEIARLDGGAPERGVLRLELRGGK